jgi:phosphatidylglycerol:prolipoprotein diacylglycerol transferase
MRPIPVVFHIGPLQLHTYGIGLAITFWFAYRYFARRLRDNGYPDQWLGAAFIWIVVAAVVGARVFHVVAHWSFYTAYPGQILEVWHGGLSSFGGLVFAIPVGMYLAHRWCPELRAWRAADLVTPVLLAAWAIGRLLGPQLMVAGGGKPTTAWFGMYYADEVGKRLPVPIFQSLETTVVFVVALAAERYMVRHGTPSGFVLACGEALWGLSRFFDQYFFLPYNAGTDPIEITGLVMLGVGVIGAAVLLSRPRDPNRYRRPPFGPSDPAEDAVPELAGAAPVGATALDAPLSVGRLHSDPRTTRKRTVAPSRSSSATSSPAGSDGTSVIA